ncbi:hypothetical protein LTS08_004388 [Lithohypha guttulata]|uniref:Xylanolytic transcriptional activator regulatory domain-containing protein n=1 Tax=Lithohypha guttulata TaxID=1690604 RepID=A0AAN7SZN9_9EURO|nr:hypothetical protein LTR51_007649 [Lithohypha guttulata]KAK5086302.1 hypothetical protein LTR05_003470 [Lithohypha guttulata]KAK5101929.1 hypothetical protein LTS08_004388 [Lithohypha guttulata]
MSAEKGRGDECVYKLSPTLSYTTKLERRVEELEAALRKAQVSAQVVPALSPSVSVTSPTSYTGEGGSAAFRGLAFDARGAVTFHGSTSLFQLPTRPEETNTILPVNELHLTKERLVQNAWEQRSLEVLAETPQPFQFLLSTHWCWIQPLFNFVYRPAFTRDMQSIGPYYSHTLLNALLGHSVRWCKREPEIRHLLEPYEGGALFKRHARTRLFEEISTGNCSIPTIQTLLILSAQECSAGNRTSAILYCRMAFNLLEELGITVDVQRYGSGNLQLSDEDIEIRRRLFWSCYFWDKIISLYLGRSPALSHSPVSPPQVIMDDSAEDELWLPHGVQYPEGQQYPPTQAHSISCFTQMCRLSAIFNEILLHMYDPLNSKTEQEIDDCLIREGFAMRQWWQDLPSFLKIEAQDLPQYAPPSHIVTLNCLFHTFKILLYRPMLFKRPESLPEGDMPNPAHFKECLGSASAIVAVFDLYCRTFTYSRVVLSLAYSVYTAASIYLLQIQASSVREDYTLDSMRFCVQALDRLKASSPVIGQALQLLLRALADAGIQASEVLELSSQPDVLLNPTTTDVPVSSHLPQAPAVFDPDGIDFTPEMFATFSNLEPITVAVGAGGIIMPT